MKFIDKLAYTMAARKRPRTSRDLPEPTTLQAPLRVQWKDDEAIVQENGHTLRIAPYGNGWHAWHKGQIVATGADPQKALDAARVVIRQRERQRIALR
jgi:hypothetical protein